MTIATKLTDEQFKYIKTTVKVDLHPIFGMHLRAKTLDEILSDPYSENLDLVKIRRSCGMTKGGFIRESCTVGRYLQYTSRYFDTRLTLATHRVIFMLLNNINLESNQIINHIDGNTFNNHISNLEVVTTQENSHISKSKYRQQNINIAAKIDENGLYRSTFTYKNIRHTFGTSPDFELITKVTNIINEIRINIVGSDEVLIKFIEVTKYKTLEDRLSLLKINVFSDSFLEIYNSIVNFLFTQTLTDIKQAGVRQTPYNTFRVEIRVAGKPVSFGTYASLIEANEIALQIRTIKCKNLIGLLDLINRKSKIQQASSYYKENLWRLLL